MRFLVLCTIFLVFIVTPGRMQDVDKRSEKVRQVAVKIAAERDHLGEVKFRTGDKRKGFISSVNQDTFTFQPSKGGAAESVRFADVDSIKQSRKGLSNAAWIAIGAVSAAAVIVMFTVIKPALLCDGGAAC